MSSSEGPLVNSDDAHIAPMITLAEKMAAARLRKERTQTQTQTPLSLKRLAVDGNDDGPARKRPTVEDDDAHTAEKSCGTLSSACDDLRELQQWQDGDFIDIEKVRNIMVHFFELMKEGLEQNKGKIVGVMQTIGATEAKYHQVSYITGLELQEAMEKLDIAENAKTQLSSDLTAVKITLEASKIAQTKLRTELKSSKNHAEEMNKKYEELQAKYRDLESKYIGLETKNKTETNTIGIEYLAKALKSEKDAMDIDAMDITELKEKLKQSNMEREELAGENATYKANLEEEVRAIRESYNRDIEMGLKPQGGGSLFSPRQRWAADNQKIWYDEMTAIPNVLKDGKAVSGTKKRFESRLISIALELMRRGDPTHPVMQRFCTLVKPELEYSKYDYHLYRNHKNPFVIALNAAITKTPPPAITFEQARDGTGVVLREEREKIMQLIHLHVWFQSKLKLGRDALQTIVVHFYDRKFSYQVHELVGTCKSRWQERKFDSGPVMRLGGDSISVRRGLNCGGNDQEVLKKVNTEIWKRISE